MAKGKNVAMKTTTAAKPAPTKSEGKGKAKLKVAPVTPGQNISRPKAQPPHVHVIGVANNS